MKFSSCQVAQNSASWCLKISKFVPELEDIHVVDMRRASIVLRMKSCFASEPDNAM
jgi:hypothetical protein